MTITASFAKSFGATGLDGAVIPTRYAGGTSGGPPSTGTFDVGHWVTDVTGTIWICVTAGSPGTWTDVSSGKELGYAEITANPTAVSGTTVVDITGLSITFTARSRPIVVVSYCMGALNNTATARTENLLITDDANNTKQSGKLYLNASALSASITPRYRYSPTPGNSYTFKIRAGGSNAASNFTLQAGATFPMSIQAIEV